MAGDNFGVVWRDLADTAVSGEVLVYCDTGSVVAIIMGEVDPFFDDAVRFFNAVKSSGVRLVISSLVLAEVTDVIRKRIKARHRCTDESGMEREVVDAGVAATVKDINRFINALKLDKMVDMYEATTKTQPDISRLYEKMLGNQGRTPQARKGDTYRHLGMGPVDLIHAEMAYLAGALAICTTDKAFAQIGDNKQYSEIWIIILRARQVAEHVRTTGR